MTKKLGINSNKKSIELAFNLLDENNDKQLEF